VASVICSVKAWRETGERFVDPVSGRPVTVYEKTATGERRYVDSGSAPS